MIFINKCNNIMKRDSVKHILMLLSNPATYDIRPLKEARTLAENGFKVIILAWDREGIAPRLSLAENLLIHRLNLRAPYGQSIKVLVRLLVFYMWCIITSFIYRFQAIHCHDADMFLCGVLLKVIRLGRVKLVYDMHDHPLIFLDRFPMHRFLVKVIFAVARKYADHVIVVNEIFSDYLSKMGFEGQKISVIMNVPQTVYSTDKSNYNKKKFVILYYGNINADRGVLKLAEAIAGLKNVELLLAGRGDLVSVIKVMEEKFNNIKYLGWIPIDEINKLTRQADLIPSLYSPSNINNMMASPGKLFTAMAYGIPVLVPKGSYQAKIAGRYKCGIAVNINDTTEVKNVIVKLISSPDLHRELGENGIKAVSRLFNWGIMEKRLIEMYSSLLF